MINLSKRLLKCASFVSKGGISVDVGSDHAQLPVFLIQNSISTKSYACDINRGPLNAAVKTVEKCGLSDKVEIILSDGLDEIDGKGVTDVVIAGMGAELIINILSRADWLKESVNLVLQPMTKVQILRKWLYNNGFTIKAEHAVEDDRFVYPVINAVFINEFKEIDNRTMYFGKIDFSDSDGRKYAEIQQRRLRVRAEGILKANTQDNQAIELLSLANSIKEELG